jgi:DNA-binding NarL/FixJ family response regulator
MMGLDSWDGRFGVETKTSLEDLEAQLRAVVSLIDRELKRLAEPGEREQTVASVFKLEAEGHTYVLIRLPLVAWEKLCLQERRVAISVREGLSNKEIATGMDLKTCTVEELIRRIFGKLEIENRVQLAIVSLVETEKGIHELSPPPVPGQKHSELTT